MRWHDRIDDGAKIILARSQIDARQLVRLRRDHPVRLLDFTGFGMKPLAELVSDGRVDDMFTCDASQYGSSFERLFRRENVRNSLPASSRKRCAKFTQH